MSESHDTGFFYLPMKILAIETSCDETAIAIAEFSGSKKKPALSVLSNIVSSQMALHAKFGGVVPNLARREHQKNLPHILKMALQEAGMLARQPKKRSLREIEKILGREPELLKRFKKEVVTLKAPDIDAIAVTHGPGLAPALWVGVNFANALAKLWHKPIFPINHMEGHLYSALLNQGQKLAVIKFPALALLVSGGHTELVLIKNFGKYKIIGETLDDAAGEAFDKVARILGLPYPGGPEISKAAENSKVWRRALPRKLPRPMLNSKDYNFSFSGLKTAVLYLVRDLPRTQPLKIARPAIAKEFQSAVVDVLIAKTIRAAKEYKVKTILLGGGVAANKLLRKILAEETEKNLPTAGCRLPALCMTGDNALMIALAAILGKNKKTRKIIRADANIRLGN